MTALKREGLSSTSTGLLTTKTHCQLCNKKRREAHPFFPPSIRREEGKYIRIIFMKTVTVSLLMLILLQGLQAESLKIITSHEAPLNYLNEEGVLTGITVDVVHEIQKRVGDSSPIKIYPWARLYSYVEHEPNVVAFTMARTEEREDKFHWITLINRNEWVLIAPKGSKMTISNIEDAKNVHAIGITRGSAMEQVLLNLGFQNLEPVTNDEQNIKKLMADRVSLLFHSSSGIIKTCWDLGIDFDNEFEIVHSVQKSRAYIVMSKGTEMSTVEQWQQAALQMKNDGTFDRLMKKWVESLLKEDGIESHIEDGGLNLWKEE